MASPLCALALCFAAGVYVHDGDGIGRGPDRVRLLGIQAPEIGAPGAIASRDHLRAFIAGKVIACQPEYRDRFGRQVARCYLPDGRDLACEQVRAGMARDWPRYSGGEYRRCE